MENGDCIGGFTKCHWSSPDSVKFFGDNEAFLFNLTKERVFPSTKSGDDICCFRDMGPSFNGGNESELDVEDDPFNGQGKCCSNTN